MEKLTSRLTCHVTAFQHAVQFLTIIPIKTPVNSEPDTSGLSLLYYPFVGAAVGLILLTCANIIVPIFPDLLSAALIVFSWMVLTGALHIDGLADCADAWVGGHGSRSRTMELMKDPTCGPVAVAIVVMLLMIKVVAVSELFDSDDLFAFIWVPTLARLSILVLFLTTPYVREGGLGEMLHRQLSRPKAIFVCIVLSVLLLFSNPLVGTVLIIVAVMALWLVRRLMVSRLGGCTGDTVGASVEILETMGLLVLVALSTGN